MTLTVMLIVSLLIPTVMIVFGGYFRKHEPTTINYIFGYRTKRSMKNEKTWAFAHHTLGKLWYRLGLLLLLTVVPLFFFIRSPDDAVGTVGCIIMLVQTAALILSIIPVERALKKRFDDDGNEKE